jgi:hypothetical protein
MTYMQSRTAWIRKHIEHVELLLRRVIAYLVGVCIIPLLLPFLFNIPEIVFH